MAVSDSSSSSSITVPQHISAVFYWHDSDINDRDFQIHGRTIYFAVILFCTVFASAVLFLYLRWTCNLHAPPHAPPPTTNLVVGDGGLDPTAIRSLPVMLCRRDLDPEVAESECCICLGGFEDGDKVKMLPPCGHCFHCQCVDRWLSAESSCPLCRATLRVDSVVVVVAQ